jgi:hemerythrin-like domain-containing protein
MATSKLYDAMREDHQRLERVFETLLNYVHVDDREGMQAAWDDFERGLSAHLEVEEAEMIPVLDRDNQEEAAAIRRDHAMIRRTLAELGVRLDIHLLREETVEAFVRLLRSHAAREEALLYRAADATLGEEPKASILERLAAARRRPGGRAEAA